MTEQQFMTEDKTVIMESKKGVEEWSVDKLTRWMCLIEAFSLINEKAKELGVKIENMNNVSKSIESYIYGVDTPTKKFSGRYHSMRHDVGVELEMGLL